MKLALVLSVACVHFAYGGTWIGMTPEINQPTNIALFLLNEEGSRVGTIGHVQLQTNERVSMDSFRCKPYGTYCLLTSFNGSSSFLYNVSAFTAAVSSRTEVPGAEIHNLHLDTFSNSGITVMLKQSSAVVVRIHNEEVTPLVDISEYVGSNGSILPGSTTQCSDDAAMWVGIKKSGGAPDLIVELNLDTQNVTNVITLKQRLVTAMWASCNDRTGINHPGGVTSFKDTSIAAYVRFSSDGSMELVESTTIPTNSPPLQLTPLLNEPLIYDYFFAMYPEGSAPGDDVSGVLAFGNFNAGNMKLVKISYFLTASARLN